ncbi:2-C-methyl-D-erythritol 4-phosphate cytidylyltransferase [Candidatus Palibaumannia cicadellinicola]|uniref:2-C-methyl-D-erythritol 4-phosphate cytidylyltransferase n=1 Tax=Candidatus Palibaumannia cicadellinicola TaxID=186490 RepID=A0A0K2BKR8_9GAMM|nr:2-C-methyl-D-erythritol 4-phosphate cytidylyltransferase [Candidatus Baumannia cicadellinicola]AKZ65789.1 2-C-methyl-D-erythritol 4-phosphate cytidylyltransferase [Candidatus Baumannia cicadellinicola]
MTLFSVKLPNVVAIIPAAGIGIRMQHSFPKQYINIGTKTILEYAISALLRQPCISKIIVAISPNDRWFHKLPISYEARVIAVLGGINRADSVMLALRNVKHDVSWVLVHDAVRPCLHQTDLLYLLNTVIVGSKIGGILAKPVRDTIKHATSSSKGTELTTIDHTLERTHLWHALTPQLFMFELLNNCLNRAINEGVSLTDESSALEYYGYRPLLVPGRTDNIKVTWPEDISLARFYLSQEEA